MKHAVRAVVVLALALARVSRPGPRTRGCRSTTSGVPRGIALYGDVGFPNDDGGRRHRVRRHGAGRLRPARAPRPRCRRSIRTGPAGGDVVGRRHPQLQAARRPAGAALGHAAGRGRATPSQARASLPGPGSSSESAYRFPVGIGFALVIPNPALSIHPWLAPRVDIAYTEGRRRLRHRDQLRSLRRARAQPAERLRRARGLRPRVRQGRRRPGDVRRRRALRLPGTGPVRSRSGAVALAARAGLRPRRLRPDLRRHHAGRPRDPRRRRRVSRRPATASRSRARRCSGSGASRAQAALAAQGARRAARRRERRRRREDPGAEPLERRAVHGADRGADRPADGHLRGGRDEISSASISADRRAAPSPRSTTSRAPAALPPSGASSSLDPSAPQLRQRAGRRRVPPLERLAPRLPRAAAPRPGSPASGARTPPARPRPPARAPSAGPRGRSPRRRTPCVPAPYSVASTPTRSTTSSGVGPVGRAEPHGRGQPGRAGPAVERRRDARPWARAARGSAARPGAGARDTWRTPRAARPRPAARWSRPRASGRRRRSGAAGRRRRPRPPAPPRCRSADRPARGSAPAARRAGRAGPRRASAIAPAAATAS